MLLENTILEAPALVIATIAIVAITTTAIYFFFLRERDTYKGKTLPPFCPSGYVNTIHQMTTSNAPWFLLDMAHKVGFVYRVRLPIARDGAFVVGDSQLARKLLKDPHCQVKPAFTYARANLVTKGSSVFSSNGHDWAHRRKGIAPSFSSTQVKRMNRVCEEHIQKWIDEQKQQQCHNDYEPFDVSNEMIRLTVRIVCESAFEYNVTSQEIDALLHELDLSMREFLLKNEGLGIRTTVGPFLLKEHRRAQVASDRLEEFAMKMIKAHQENPNASSETILGRIMNNPNYRDDWDRASDVVTLLIAGYDTTGYSLAWIFLELAKHPEEMMKLRNDMLQHGPDNWKQSSRLGNVIREGLRLHPVVAFFAFRVIGRDVVYGKNKECIIPENGIATFPLLLLHRNPDVYEKANEFIPSRWENMSQMGLDAYMPFVSGSRNCVGQALANAELYSTVARVVMNFDLEVVDEGKPDFFLTLKPEGAMLRVKPAVVSSKA